MSFLIKILSSLILLFNYASYSNAKDVKLNEINNLKSKIFFMRHAIAPGFGDPKNFEINDCKTQRNLNELGILQAKNIGKQLKKNKIKFSKIFSSFWCRCYQTIKAMGIKEYELHQGLNSFYQNYFEKNKVLEDLKSLISFLDKNNGPYLFVTHYVVIGSYTKLFPSSGGIVVHDLNSLINQNVILENQQTK